VSEAELSKTRAELADIKEARDVLEINTAEIMHALQTQQEKESALLRKLHAAQNAQVHWASCISGPFSADERASNLFMV
jgi:hypothetical protein